MERPHKMLRLDEAVQRRRRTIVKYYKGSKICKTLDTLKQEISSNVKQYDSVEVLNTGYIPTRKTVSTNPLKTIITLEPYTFKHNLNVTDVDNLDLCCNTKLLEDEDEGYHPVEDESCSDDDDDADKVLPTLVRKNIQDNKQWKAHIQRCEEVSSKLYLNDTVRYNEGLVEEEEERGVDEVDAASDKMRDFKKRYCPNGDLPNNQEEYLVLRRGLVRVLWSIYNFFHEHDYDSEGKRIVKEENVT